MSRRVEQCHRLPFMGAFFESGEIKGRKGRGLELAYHMLYPRVSNIQCPYTTATRLRESLSVFKLPQYRYLGDRM